MSEPPGWQAPGSAPPPGGEWGAGWSTPPGWVGPARTGVVPLRPLGLGELLDGAVRTMRHNPRVMFGLSALVMGLAVLISTGLLLAGLPQALNSLDAAGEFDRSDLAGLVSAGVVGLVVPAVVQLLALSVLNGVLILAVSEAVIDRRPTAGDVLRRAGWRGAGRLVLLTLLTGLIGFALLLVVAAPVALLYLAAVPAGVVATLLAVPLVAAGALYLMVAFAFAAPALLLEHLGVAASLRRSWRLGRGSRWRVLGIVLLTGVIGAVTSSLLQLPFSVVGALVQVAVGSSGDGAAGTLTLAAVVGYAVQNLGAVLSAAIVSPFSAAVVCLLYVDLRIRREGLDVALARAAEPA